MRGDFRHSSERIFLPVMEAFTVGGTLQFALSRTGIIDAGDTLLLRGGTYHGTFTSYLHGAPGSPVIIR